MNYQDTNKISLVCEECAYLSTANTTTTVSLDNESLEILGFEAKVICLCPNCKKGLMVEYPSDMAPIVQTLQEKHYRVVDCNPGYWGSDIYAPYIKVLSGGPVKIMPPKGWKDVTGPSVGSFQVFSPNGSYGCADDDANPLDYATDKVFKTEEEFNKHKEHYMARLVQWVNELEMNTTIATKQAGRTLKDPLIIDAD